MKRHVTLLLGVGMLSALLTTGGCLVPKSRLDAARAANAQANQQLQQALASKQGFLRDSESLRAMIAGRNAALDTKGKEVSLLQSEVNRLRDSEDDLKRRLNVLMNRDDVPAIGGPLPMQVDRALRAFSKANPDLMEYLPKYGMVKMKSDLTFPPGGDAVKTGASEALGKLVKILQTPDAARLSVYIAGHTDDMRIAKPETRRRHPTNWYLSVHRAVGVQKALVRAGLAPQRIAAMGFGEYHPIVPNKPDKKGNALNRRVEIWILPGGRFLTASSVAPAAEK